MKSSYMFLVDQLFTTVFPCIHFTLVSHLSYTQVFLESIWYLLVTTVNMQNIGEIYLSSDRQARRENSRQWSLHHNEIVTHIIIPLLGIKRRVPSYVKSRNHQANQHAHLHPCEVLPSTIGLANGEWKKSSGIVDVLILSIKDLGLQDYSLVFGKPTFG